MKTKPKIRLVPVSDGLCNGCSNRHAVHGPCHKLPVRCVSYQSGQAQHYHIKIVGEHTSTR